MMKVIAVIFIIFMCLVVLYMLAIMPRMIKKPLRAPLMGVLYAHRGLHDNKSDAPENSMPAFQKAVEAGYGIELDVQLTKDRVPVVFHDFTLDRMCGVSGKVADYTFEELQKLHLLQTEQKIPKFEDFLKLVEGKVPFILELKVEMKDIDVCSKVSEMMKQYKGIYCIESFNPLVLRWYRKYDKGVIRGQLSDVFVKESKNAKAILHWTLENLIWNFITKPDFIAYNHHHYRKLSRCICRYIYGNLAVAWTIRSQEELNARKKDFDLFIFDSFIPKEK